MMSSGILVLSFERPDVPTVKFLTRYGYTGDWRIVCSSDDRSLDEYFARYGDRVVVFDRDGIDCDHGDNWPAGQAKSVLPARNAAWDIAKSLGWSRFALFDDDYIELKSSPIFVTGKLRNMCRIPCFLDRVSEIMWECLESMPHFVFSISLGQAGDISFKEKLFVRKAMQTFYLLSSRPFRWVARGNDDVTTYYNEQIRGNLFIQNNVYLIKQRETQKHPGGLTEFYKHGTYLKSAYTVLWWPGMVRIGHVPSVGRVHHRIKTYSYPCIIRAGA